MKITKTIILKIIAIKIILKIVILLVFLSFFNNSYSQNLSLPTAMPVGLPNDFDPKNFLSSQEKNNSNEISFTQITLNNLLTIVFTEIETRNFILSPQVLNDTRLVSFRYNIKKNGNLLNFLTPYLQDLGYSVENINNTIYVNAIVNTKDEDYEYYIYTPKHRTANYISKLLKPYFLKYLESTSGIVDTDKAFDTTLLSTNSIANNSEKEQDFLTFKYDNDKIKNKILNFIEKIDIEEQNLIARAYVYEVSYNKKEGSAFAMMLNLLSSKLKINVSSINSYQDFVSFSNNALSLFVSNINENNNVKLISNPILRIKNNKESSFVVGNSVPTLGNITTSGNGIVQQSIDYVDTGLTFKIIPTIMKDSITIDLKQSISDAVKTDTGVNNSPTLTKRDLNVFFTLKKNEVVMLSALTQNKIEKSVSKSFIFPIFDNKINSDVNTDIVIFFEVLDTTSSNLYYVSK